MLAAIRQRAFDEIWKRDPAETNPLHRLLVNTARMFYVVIRDLADGQLTLRSMSLVYTTLLSLVPLLAFSFSLLKGLGVHNQLEPLLFTALEGLGPKGQEVGERIMSFVDNIRADILGSFGLAILIYTVISLVQKIEEAFNYVWRVQQPRSLARRFSDYLSVIIVGPLLIVAAIGITASFTSNAVVRTIIAIEPFGTLILLLSSLAPYLMVIGAFTFIYVFVPNTRVRFIPALTGGVVAGILWQTAGKLFAAFVASSTKYTAIYSGFAIGLLFMIWLYLGWLILLVGAQIAFYQQHSRFIVPSKTRLFINNRLREKLALLIMYLVGKSYSTKQELWTIDSLASVLRIPADALSLIMRRLEKHGLLLATENETYIPGSDMDCIALKDILIAVRQPNTDEDYPDTDVQSQQPVEAVMQEVESAIDASLRAKTLKDLIRAPED
ncbi:MAG: YihY/virulence factor BrkB family protein [Gammaproteobacteria bacterium]|nr:YihY/virulence factor BrkB family protein [Gammaproteobacteria bacterium]